MKAKVYSISKALLSGMVALNIISLLTSIVFSITTEVFSIMAFDVIVCLIMFIYFIYGFLTSSDRKVFLKEYWLLILAAVPFDLLMAPFLSFEFLLVLKLIRVLILMLIFFRIVGEFLKYTRLDEILGVLLIIIIGSTLGLYLIDPTMNNLFDNLWFVVVSITTVGYGDITPNTVYGKVLSLVLLLVGVFMFSAITGAISSYFMDNLLQAGTYHIHDLKDKVAESEKELEKVNAQLKVNDKKIDELKEEIKELKEIMEKNN